MGFAGCGNPPLCPPARARTCAVVGGYMRGAGERGSAGAATLRHTLRAEDCTRELCCSVVSPFLAEPIQNGFCGMRKSAPLPAGSCAHLRSGRWVYEGGGRARQRGRGNSAAYSASRGLHARALLFGREPIFSGTHTKWVLRDAEIRPTA